MDHRKKLADVESARQQLQANIRNLEAKPPSHLEIQLDGDLVRFPIDAVTGKVGELPEKGVWGWARGLRWTDLIKFLKKEGYDVRAKGMAP